MASTDAAPIGSSPGSNPGERDERGERDTIEERPGRPPGAGRGDRGVARAELRLPDHGYRRRLLRRDRRADADRRAPLPRRRREQVPGDLLPLHRRVRAVRALRHAGGARRRGAGRARHVARRRRHRGDSGPPDRRRRARGATRRLAGRDALRRLLHDVRTEAARREHRALRGVAGVAGGARLSAGPRAAGRLPSPRARSAPARCCSSRSLASCSWRWRRTG